MIYEWNQVFFNLIIILPTKKKKPKKTHRKTNQLSNHLCIKYPLHITKTKTQQLHVSIKALFKELFFISEGSGSRGGRTGTLPSIWREGQTGYTIMSTAPSSSMRRRTSSTNSLCSMQWDTLG